MMLKICCFILLLSCLPAYGQNYPVRINQWRIGADLSQFYYVFGAGKTDVNASICGQYKPFYFLSLNSSFIYNSVNNQMGKGYINLNDYHCNGASIKLGFDLSIKISRDNKNTRAFIGIHGLYTRYRESGNFEIDNYWGKHVKMLETNPRHGFAKEFVFGIQFSKKRWSVRPQIYAIYVRDDQRISRNDNIAYEYYSPFVPGFGYDRVGLNLILFYNLGNYPDMHRD